MPHLLQAMPLRLAAPSCPSTHVRCRSEISVRAGLGMRDDRVRAGRAGFAAHASCPRCVRHWFLLKTVRLVPSNANVHCEPRSHRRATRQRMSLRAATHSGSVFTSMQSSALAPRRRTRLLPMNIHGRQLARARACVANDACERTLLARSPPTSAHAMPEWIDLTSPRAIPSPLEYSSMPER